MKLAGLIAVSTSVLVALAWSGTAVAAEPSVQPIKVVYHLDDARNGRFALLIAEDHLAASPDMEIAMVAYAGGVDFLLKDATDKRGKPFAPDVQALMDKGVRFEVCLNTLRLREIDRSRVLDGVGFVPSGTFEVIRLQAEEGYVYLKP